MATGSSTFVGGAAGCPPPRICAAVPVQPAPVVDVGIPAHGRPRFVSEAVESVLAQRFDAWRLVISEDGPSGGPVAEAVAPYLDDPRVHYSSTGTRAGAAANMTALINSGSAPYVALLHDDDRWAPGFLGRRVEFLERHRECGLVFGRSLFIDEHGNRIGGRSPALPPGIHLPARFVPAMLRRNIVPVETVLVRRSAYEAVGPTFDGRFPHIYDYEMWLRIGARFPVGRLDVMDAEWRRHGAQSSYDGHERGAELLAFFEHAEQLVARELPALRIPERRRRYVRGRRLLTAGLDAVQRGDRAIAAGYVRDAVRTWPPLALNPRLALALASTACGRRGHHVLRAVRYNARRNGLRLPF